MPFVNNNSFIQQAGNTTNKQIFITLKIRQPNERTIIVIERAKRIDNERQNRRKYESQFQLISNISELRLYMANSMSLLKTLKSKLNLTLLIDVA